ncbi:probable serine/threonine-protein kinase MARK-A [Octopus bimaculoides]|uniref:Uncharacterized protein n=1 Tax=Octopus bimaculoides TaxID=37653 RepID=A0A0L8HYI1_OCTBM|nr:probable serine/threonine-protein kinase MARK-A [Octopus bimaculoides]XP_014768285.1 probable serine/threonine-protein kinase MARK-A [Octopus bimaculoides]XP_014768286.1 probable serine/threonine-protein kinase MARK-A [Octopus bimaculoides]XP_014768287.1 probable serine/threonine-protein kinase MARK-A [Octopus bimaculoides]|eukprot:XP_014768284.1 PREDICTED: probable serine/threonine-protein kinase MARK-A [Octopus bimaculoides]
MRRFRSSQSQCCCCVVAILLSLGSVILTGIGVCVILKYVMIRTDLLLPELQNHDGQKIVGIILTSVGVLGIIISAIVAILYFTVCHESRSGQPAVAQKICKNGIKENSNSPATPKTEANGQNKFHNSHLHPPKSPTKMQPFKPKSPFGGERMVSAKPISTIGVPLTSTPRRMRGAKNGRPLSSNLDIVEEVDSDVPLPLLQINGIDIGLTNGRKCVDNVIHNGQNDVLRPILKSSSNTTTTTTTITTATNTLVTSNNIASTNSIAAAATSNTNSVSRSLFSMKNIPDSSTDNNHNNNNNTTTTVTSASSSSHTSSVHSKPYHDSTTTTTITDLDQSNCDSDQDIQTHDSDCEITSSRL